MAEPQVQAQPPPAPPPDPLPWDVRVIAALNVGAGLVAVIQTIGALVRGRHLLHFGILLLPVGWGLFRRSDRWRQLGVVLALLIMAGPLLFVVMNALGRVSAIHFPGSDSGVPGIVAGAVVIVGLSAWEVYILMRARTRAAFQPRPLT